MAQFGTDVNDLPSDLLAIDEAAEEFHISRRTIFRLIEQHEIPRYRKPGDRKTYISRGQLTRHMGFREIPAKYDAD